MRRRESSAEQFLNVDPAPLRRAAPLRIFGVARADRGRRGPCSDAGLGGGVGICVAVVVVVVPWL